MTDSQSTSHLRPKSDHPLRIVIVGHVDHGKSTLVGRLFHDTGSLPEGKLESIQASCERRGVPFEWAFLMDAFKSEKDQNITIDTAQIWFHTEKRQYVIIDAPGHKEFIKNMVTGAAQADAALLLIAADEGVQEQSKRHGYLLSMLGIKQVVVVVNKMDLADYSETRFNEVCAEYREFLSGIGVEPMGFVPVSAREGDGVATLSSKLNWYGGGHIVDTLDAFSQPPKKADDVLRFPLQDVYRFDHRRILAGRIESGSLKAGDTLTFYPGGKQSKIKSLEFWEQEALNSVGAGQSVGITLETQLFVERGHVAIRSEQGPIACSDEIRARLFWLGQRPLEVGRGVKVKLATQEVEARVHQIHRLIDASTLNVQNEGAKEIRKNDVAEVTLRLREEIAFDNADVCEGTGRFVIVDDYEVAGGGIIVDAPYRSTQEKAQAQPISPRERNALLGHEAGLIIFGDSLSEDSRTLVENRLHQKRILTYRLSDDEGSHLTSLLNAGVVVLAEHKAESLKHLGAHQMLLSSEDDVQKIDTFILRLKGLSDSRDFEI